MVYKIYDKIADTRNAADPAGREGPPTVELSDEEMLARSVK